jgi:predicted nucleic acid-binding protein
MAKRPTEALVVDASVAVKWHLPDEEDADRAAALLERFLKGDAELWAPEYVRYEVPAAIARATRRTPPRLPAAQGREAIEEFLGLPFRTIDSGELLLTAYPLVHQHEIALSDQRLFERIGRLPFVQRIGDYQA